MDRKNDEHQLRSKETIFDLVRNNRLAITLTLLGIAIVRSASHELENWYNDNTGLHHVRPRPQEMVMQVEYESRRAGIIAQKANILARLQACYATILRNDIFSNLDTNFLTRRNIYSIIDDVRARFAAELLRNTDIQSIHTQLHNHRHAHRNIYCDNDEYIEDSFIFSELRTHVASNFTSYGFVPSEAAQVAQTFQLNGNTLDACVGSREIYLKNIIREGQRHGDVRGRLLPLLMQDDWHNQNAFLAYRHMPSELQLIIRRMFCDRDLAVADGAHCHNFMRSTYQSNK